MSVEIIYQDPYIVAVNKPEGLLAVPGRGAHKHDSVYSRLLSCYQDIRIVHRLDCYTSGIMLLAIGLPVQRELSRQFHDREIDKQYLAQVHGVVDGQQGVVDIAMRGDPATRPRQVIDARQGKPALTRWSVLARDDRSTRLSLRPVTGRTHQLRVHCMAMGFPIIGDRLYGRHDEADRMMLHAHRIAFTHPFDGSRVQLEAACDF